MSIPTRKSLSSSRSTEMKNLFRHTITSAERSSITQYILDAENEVKDYQAEINRLKTMIWTLENRKDALKKSMTRFQFLLSPVYKLPPEILITIFDFCCENNELVALPYAQLPMAVALSRVCGRWRDIMFSAPRLWTSLTIHFGGWTQYPNQLTSLTKMFMERSDKSGLKIRLDFNNMDEKLEAITPALTALIQNCVRWTHARLIIPAAIIRHNMFEAVRGRLPVLEHLYLTGCGQTEDTEDAHIDLFEHCPSLWSFEYKASSPSIIATVPWKQIKSLKLCNYYSTFAFDRLSWCTNAERLRLHIVGGGREYRSHIVSDIKDLSLTVHEQVDVSSIFKYSTFRNLSSLEIHGLFDEPDEGWETWEETSISSFLSRSSCSMTTLRLQWLPITDEQTLALLHQLPTLTTLYIEEYRNNTGENTIVTTRFLSQLLVDHGSSSPALLPNLADLSLVAHERWLDPEDLLKVVTSRWLPDGDYAGEVGVECLRVFTLSLMSREKDGAVLDKFSGLLCFKDAGMRMVLSHLIVS